MIQDSLTKTEYVLEYAIDWFSLMLVLNTFYTY